MAAFSSYFPYRTPPKSNRPSSPVSSRERLAAIVRWVDLNHTAGKGLAAARIDDFPADVPRLGYGGRRRIRLLRCPSSGMERKQQRKHRRGALPVMRTVHLRFSGHYLELDFRFVTASERYFLAQRQIPLQRLMIAVRQLLLLSQRQHQVAAGGKPLELLPLLGNPATAYDPRRR